MDKKKELKLRLRKINISEKASKKIVDYKTYFANYDKDTTNILKILYANRDKVNIGNILLVNEDETKYEFEKYKYNLKEISMYKLERLF
jgi:hypothetical protein